MALLAAAQFAIVSGNESPSGLPAFSINAVTGLLRVASELSYWSVPEKRTYNLGIALIDDDFTVVYNVTAYMVYVRVPPFFFTQPNGSISVYGA